MVHDESSSESGAIFAGMPNLKKTAGPVTHDESSFESSGIVAGMPKLKKTAGVPVVQGESSSEPSYSTGSLGVNVKKLHAISSGISATFGTETDSVAERASTGFTVEHAVAAHIGVNNDKVMPIETLLQATEAPNKSAEVAATIDKLDPTYLKAVYAFNPASVPGQTDGLLLIEGEVVVLVMRLFLKDGHECRV